MAEKLKDTLSPMMQHYLQLKETHKDTILLYRLGDFYEMFFDDALDASKLLDLTLTGRDCGLQERAPMCGVPYHAVDGYIAKLVECGRKVAICEQLSNPGDQKGLVKRDIIRVITPGTVIDDAMLEKEKNNYLLAVNYTQKGIGLAYLDMNEGEINLFQPLQSQNEANLEDFLQALSPSEIICNSAFIDISAKFLSIQCGKLVKPQAYYDYAFSTGNAEASFLKQIQSYSVQSLGLTEKDALLVSAAGALCDYIQSTQKRELGHINRVKIIRNSSFMLLDYNTKRNLELTENLSDRSKNGSLLWVLDNTKTNMGARKLRRMVEEPLLCEAEINERLDAVEEFVKNPKLREGFALSLQNIRDLERLSGKISYGTVTPKECLAVSESLQKLPSVKKILATAKCPLLKKFYNQIDLMEDTAKELFDGISETAPALLKDGGVIKSGFNEALDQLRNAKCQGADWIAAYEAKEKERTGIRTLKVNYNRVFGYYIEISNSFLSQAPLEYVRKQTISTGERFITEELKKMEEMVLGAEEKALTLEQTLFAEIREHLRAGIKRLQVNAEVIASADALYSLATVAVKNNYVRPNVSEKLKKIVIQDGRHPVVEAYKRANEFVPNDTELTKDSHTLIITGPNMAGKSTYMRQVALIVLMAHLGSFVPAKKADIAPVDRVFTRVGASDNLSQGQSTFMVEMIEVASILNNATEKSLLILDEIGRGTSTLDGLSIAWSIIEFLIKNVKAKTLFATHYHELSELESLLPGVKNYRILIHEGKDNITFLYKIARGGANKSYGIEVAALAGIKKEVIDRARNILNGLSESHTLSGDITEKMSQNASETAMLTSQIDFFAEDPKLTEMRRILSDIDINRVTPIEALTILSDLKKLTGKN